MIYFLLIVAVVSCGLKKEEQQIEQEEPTCMYEYGICVDSLDVTRYEIGL